MTEEFRWIKHRPYEAPVQLEYGFQSRHNGAADQPLYSNYEQYIKALSARSTTSDFRWNKQRTQFPVDHLVWICIADYMSASVEIDVFEAKRDGKEPHGLKLALNSYSEDIKIRTIFVNLDIFRGIPAGIADLLGMTFDIDPHFFDVILPDQFEIDNTRASKIIDAQEYVRGEILCLPPNLYIMVFRAEKAQRTKTPVILIFNTRHDFLTRHVPSVYDHPSIYKQQIEFDPQSEMRSAQGSANVQLEEVGVLYFLLHRINETRSETTRSNPLIYMEPFIRTTLKIVDARILRLRKMLEDLRLFDPDFEDVREIYARRNALIRVLDRLPDFQPFAEAIMSQTGDPNIIPSEVDDLIRQSQATSKKGLHICARVQERIQQDTALMSIMESRRAIEESQSVKRLTQLAIVFIPLSYASSVFGMNIQEMTGNGPALWKFIVTSMALLAATVGVSITANIIIRWAKFCFYKVYGGFHTVAYVAKAWYRGELYL